MRISFAQVAAWASLGAVLMGLPSRLLALNEEKSIHYSADKQLWDRGKNQIELFGHAVVNQSGEVLTSDYMIYDQTARTLYARGDAVYIAGNTIIRGDEMHFNLDSRTGSVTAGRVSGENFTLAGERINKLGDSRYQTHWGEYSTCRDCPQTWTFMAEDVDMEIEGYATMTNVVTKFKDAPAAWFPFLIVPMKTKRQTGLLFPTFGSTDADGFKFVQPFFWAINRWSDMTIGLGNWSNRGTRVEWEGRYRLREGDLTSHFTLLNDGVHKNTDPSGKTNYSALNPAKLEQRWSLEVVQSQWLPFEIYQKLRFLEVSDVGVPVHIKDLPTYTSEPVLPSILMFSKSAPYLSGYLAMKRYRNLMPIDEDEVIRNTRFDPTTVQVYPSAALTTSDKLIPGTPLATGLTVGINNFTRSAGPFDYDYDPEKPAKDRIAPEDWVGRPGIDPIREATRFSLVPEIYTSFRLGDVLKVVPSVRYYAYFYDFHQSMPDLQRGYLLAQNELSLQFERVYDWDDRYVTRLKHLVRPKVTYSYIPYVREDKYHPFMQQTRKRPGYIFDNKDIVPLSSNQLNSGGSNYFYPLGHSVAYGLNMQLIRKEEDRENSLIGTDYRKILELSAGQAYDIRERRGTDADLSDPNSGFDPNWRKPLSRAYIEGISTWPKLQTYHLIYWHPYTLGTRYTMNHDVTWVWERAKRNKVFLFERSLTATYTYWELGCINDQCPENSPTTHSLRATVNFSINDYLMPSFQGNYNFFKTRNYLGWQANLQIQSPAQCWQFILQVPWDPVKGIGYQFDLSLNISGQGFGGFTQAAETGMSSNAGGFGTQ